MRANRLAVKALVAAVVALVVPLVPAVAALVLAVLAARRTRDAARAAPGGRGLVTAAVALAAVSLIVWTGLAAAVVLAPTGHKEPMAVATPLAVASTDTAPTTTVPRPITTVPRPTATVPRPTSGGDQRWVEAIQKLHARLDQPFQVEFELTPAKATSLARLFRGCGRELARLGSPSHRLRTVHGLVRQACAQYHESARCFAAFASPSDELQENEAFDCAAAAQEEGSVLLVEAEAEAAAIMELPADPDLTPP